MEFQDNNDPQDKMNNLLKAKDKIMGIIRTRGPCLPVHISRETGVSLLLSSALLSELLSEKRLKISYMKVGGSPLYLIPGQENLLERFHIHLPGKEKEAFSILKERSVVEDGKMLPAIRVALRSIKDFAKPVQIRDPEPRLYWRYFTIPEDKTLENVEKIMKGRKRSMADIKKEMKKIKPKEKELEKPVIREKGKKKAKEKSVFVIKVIDFLQTKRIKLEEELEFKKRDYVSRVVANSQVGEISFLCIAKDKKKVTENDLRVALQKGQSMKLPVIFISHGNLDKKAQKWLSDWGNLVSFMKIG